MNEKIPFPAMTPEEAGLPSSAVLDFLHVVENDGICMHGVIAVRYGHIIAEGYWKPFHEEQMHRIYSSGKSIVSLAIGFLADEGRISLDDHIIEYFPDKLPSSGTHPYMAETTIRHMLMMATPLSVGATVSKTTEDWVQSYFAHPPSHRPGTVFNYDSTGSHILSALVFRLTGMGFLDYLRPRLLEPIGFSEDAYCLNDPMGIPRAGSGVICTPRDFAKIALVCMRFGRFQEKQLIPEWYIREATVRQIDTYISAKHPDRSQGYGYQFWRIRNNGFAFLGMGGQLALCLPDKDFLLVVTGDSQWQDNQNAPILDALWDKVYPSLCDHALEPDLKSHHALCEQLEKLSVTPVPGKDKSPYIEKINGKTYEMDKNEMGILRMNIHFDCRSGTLRYEKENGSHHITFGYGDYVPQKFPEYGYNSIVSGAWADDTTLNICAYVADDCFGTMKMTISFKDDIITIQAKTAAQWFLDEYSGIACGTCRLAY